MAGDPQPTLHLPIRFLPVHPEPYRRHHLPDFKDLHSDLLIDGERLLPEHVEQIADFSEIDEILEGHLP
ncbi:MAG: hypothetical protein ACLSE4_05715 [Clostridium sp.]